jgi:hypothetical protein
LYKSPFEPPETTSCSSHFDQQMSMRQTNLNARTCLALWVNWLSSMSNNSYCFLPATIALVPLLFVVKP